MSAIPAQLSRGTIIVDACGLFDLAQRVPEAFRDGPMPATYLDVLRFLGRNGYRVLIPEMVALEAGQICANGFNTNSLFFHPYDKERDTFIKEYLQLATLPKRHPLNSGAEILRHTGPAAVDDYCSSMQAVPAADIANAKPGMRSATIAKESREAVRMLQTRDRKNLGDQAILSLLKRGMVTPDETVTVLTDDTDLLRHLQSQFPRVLGATAGLFLNTLGNSPIASAIGFSATAGDALNMAVYGDKTIRCGYARGLLSDAGQHMARKSGLFTSLETLATELAASTTHPHPPLTTVTAERSNERYTLPSPRRPG